MLHQRRPSPDNSWVGSCIISFVACSAFTRVTTCRLAKSPYATLYTGGSDGFVAFTAAPIATGWSDPVPGRVYLPLWSSAFHGAPKSPGYVNYRRTASDRVAISSVCRLFGRQAAKAPSSSLHQPFQRGPSIADLTKLGLGTREVRKKFLVFVNRLVALAGVL